MLEEYSIIIFKESEIVFRSKQQGIVPLIQAIEENGIEKLAKSIVLDRVVGKAAALLFVFFKAKKVYAKIISGSGLKVLMNNEIDMEFEKVVKNILNREGTDLCPFEKATIKISDPGEGSEEVGQTWTKLPKFAHLLLGCITLHLLWVHWRHVIRLNPFQGDPKLPTSLVSARLAGSKSWARS